jgi:hypothetical protein
MQRGGTRLGMTAGLSFQRLHCALQKCWKRINFESALRLSSIRLRGLSMSVLRATVSFVALVGCLLFSGLGLYSVNANGQPETVVNGYAVIQASN